MCKVHSFHIPVMGTAFSIDTPIKVAHFGISSVISLVDDTLIEQMRKYYCELTGEPYEPITRYDEDFRARRITAYLNLVDVLVKRRFEQVRNSCFEIGSEITRYFQNLPDTSPLKRLYQEMLKIQDDSLRQKFQDRLRSLMQPGSIDVNIMTKLDKTNYTQKGEPLPDEFSDALAALRGYAKSTLNSAIVFSAGINRRLYSYVEQFEDFYADASGVIKKKIILKVSDYRSSIIQGKFFAKKGIWVSEYRVESGLNCGGHAFASDGYLMGPILEEFKTKRDELIDQLNAVYSEALRAKNRPAFEFPHELKITAQGGIGTALENNFLLTYYQMDATGWATPFLLVPEVTNVDPVTLEKLSKATEDDVYLSDVSPLGVPFNNLRGNPSDDEKDRKAATGKPGSACPKGHLVSNTEFGEKPICTASRLYQKLKVEQLEKLQLTVDNFKRRYAEITQKACICHNLGEAALIKNDIPANGAKRFAAVCPGPNIAYFTKVSTLSEMIDHIYGRVNLLNTAYRPNMFIKELKMYVEYFMKEVRKVMIEPTEKQVKYLNEFRANILDGIEYYRKLFPRMVDQTEEYRMVALGELKKYSEMIESFIVEYKDTFKIVSGNLASV